LASKGKYLWLARLVPRVPARYDKLAALLLYPLALTAGLIAASLEITDLLQVISLTRFFAFIYALHAAWSGGLGSTMRRWVLFGMMPLEVLLFGGLGDGVLVGLLVYGQVIGITYAVTRRRLPVVSMFLLIAVFMFLQPAKNSYRMEAAGGGMSELNGAQRVKRFLEIAVLESGAGSEMRNIDEMVIESYSRINHLYTTAAVMEDTPSISPFRYGETLLPLVTKWIPRFMWPEKPREDLGGRWAKDYDYLPGNDDATSFNLPWLAEMYMNFGWGGVIVISLLVGVLMGAITAAVLTVSMGSGSFAFGLLISSAFFFPESNISAQIGGVVVAAGAAWIGVFLVRLMNGLVRN
jgi:hypothetical protein